MRILEVSRYKPQHWDHQSPFVTEQGEALRRAGCEVEYFLMEGSYLRQFKLLRRKIKDFGPDIIHAHYGLTAIIPELFASVPVVTTFHNGETHSWYSNLIESLCSLRAKHVIYVEKHVYDLVYFKHKHYSIIPCGINLSDCIRISKSEARKQLGWSMDKKYILFGGGFDTLRKGYPLLREAVELLTPYDSWKTSKGAEERGDIVCVELWDIARSECFVRMNACDVFALPSKSEGSPQALKEAMACGTPVVATDIADVQYMFENTKGNFLLSNKGPTKAYWQGNEQSPQELADLLKSALAFQNRTNGRERLIKIGYTNDLIAQKLMKIYESVLETYKK